MSWRRLRTLMIREVRATFRDPFTVTILIAVPLFAMLLFGYILSTEVRGLALGVHDADGSPASRRLIADLGARGTFVARAYATRSELDRALVAGDIGVALVVPPDFSRNLERAREGEPLPELQVSYDGAEAPLAGNAEAFFRGFVATSLGARASSVQVLARPMFNPSLDGVPFMIAGVFGFVLSFLTTLITAVTIVNERVSGTFEQLQVTPATSAEILLAKILPLGGIFVLDVVLMVLLAGFAMQVWPAGNPIFFVVVSAYYVLVSLSLGLIFSATSDTAAEAVQKTVLFSFPLIQLSGFVFPIRNMPMPVQWATQIFPATHYIRFSRAVYLRGEGLAGTLPEVALILLFGVILFAYALRTIEVRK